MKFPSAAGPTPFAGAGLSHVPVAHEGNQNASAEAADEILKIVHGLIAPGVTWTNRQEQASQITLEDILIVAPYNAKVATSRAKCVCIPIGNPRLFEPECRSAPQIRLANSFCRCLEMARPA